MDTVTVKLDYPTTFDSVTRDSVTLRRPKVRDQRAAQKLHPDDQAAQELALFAVLAGVAPSDLEGMDLADYNRLQDAYFRFRLPRKDQPADAQEAVATVGHRASDVAA
ncbi:MAG: phage tail assembly protein [Pararobbsia sp.]